MTHAHPTCEICERATRVTGPDLWPSIVRSIARLAYAIGYDETGDEMTELLGEVNAEEVNQ